MSDPAAPWPYIRAARLAEALGVDVVMVNGLAGQPGLRYVKTQGKSGANVFLLNREDAEAVLRKVKGPDATLP